MASQLFVVSAPSGTGKTTVVREVLKSVPGSRVAISHTTRTPRSHERHGKDYFFVGDEEFDAMLKSGGFLEHAEVFGHRYGTSRAEARVKQDEGISVIFEIDWQGACQIRCAMPQAKTIFLLPPSHDELLRRIRRRNSDHPSSVSRRLGETRNDISHWKDFHYVLINDSLDSTCRQMSRIIQGTGEEFSVNNPSRRSRVEEVVSMGGWESKK